MGSVVRVFVLVAFVAGVAALAQPDVVRRLLRDGGPGMVADVCRLPITYHLGEIEEGFALSRSRVQMALDDAVAMWESAAEDDLFERRAGVGMPIKLVFDERQARAKARQAEGSDLAASKEELEAKKAELERERSALQTEWEAFEARRREYEQRRAEYQAKVEAWNNGELERTAERQARLNEIAERLRAEAESLKQRQQALQSRRDDLELKRQALERQSQIYNDRVAAYNEQSREITGFQMGQYKQEGRDRRIHVYKAADADELRLVLAHELGHALGIQHVEPAEAVMSKDLGEANRGRKALSAADRQALSQACDVALRQP